MSSVSPRESFLGWKGIQRADEIVGVSSLRTSLSPEREKATLPSELANEAVVGHGLELAGIFARGLAELVEAQYESFPENLFWDLDALSASVIREAEESSAPATFLRESLARLVRLQHLFGGKTTIRFRYIHDFIYGYDWARWVAEAPEKRAGVGPYDRAFVDRMLRRGRELLELIREDDQKYPQLRDEGARNPFGFSREPADEAALHVELAKRELIPVRAWSGERAKVRGIDFVAERARLAAELGLGV